MWVFLSDAFLSIVSAPPAGPGLLLVRARLPGHIRNVFPKARVNVTKLSDYRYRAVVDRAEVARALIDRVAALDYPNFKDSIKEPIFKAAAGRVWSDMEDVQPGPRYAARTRASFFPDDDF